MIGAQGLRRWWTLVVLSLGVSLIVIDGTIVNVSLPVIIEDLHLGLTDAQWITTLYMLVFAGLLITTGRLGDRLGRRRLFVAGVVIFAGGSLLAGTAGDGGTLLGARAVQGVGGALILPSTLSTVNAAFRGRDRVIAFAVWGSVISGMAAIGPLVGGWLTTEYSWRWIFFINLPLGALLLAGIAAFVPETRGHEFAPGLDVDGFLLSAFGLAFVVFGLVEGRSYGWWTPEGHLSIGGVGWPAGAPISAPISAIIAGGLLLALFARWERHRARVGRSALLALSLFRFRSFRWGNPTVLIVAVGEFGLLFTLPLYLQNALGLSPLRAGFVLAAMGVGALIAGGTASELARTMRPTSIATLGLALEAGGALAVGLVVGASTPSWLIAVLLVAYGAGLGLASAQLTGIVLADVPAEQSGQGSSTQSTMRQLGSALGTAVLGTTLGVAVTAFASGSLTGIPGLRPAVRDRLENELGSSAGGIIPQIQHGHPHVPHSGAVADALAQAFAQGTRINLFIGAGILVLGLAFTLRLRASASKQTAPPQDSPDHQQGQRTRASTSTTPGDPVATGPDDARPSGGRSP
jgi:EmrB/QacA subfamily drug resistance transporter